MKIITAPENVDLSTCERPVLFLCGGISGCPNWQDEMIKLLLEDESLTGTILNPRRTDFDATKPEMAVEQITWEYNGIHGANILSFWFPKETDCPITLLELGKAIMIAKQNEGAHVIGIEPGYRRALDVTTQVGLAFPYIPLSRIPYPSTVPELVQSVTACIHSFHDALYDEEESNEQKGLQSRVVPFDSEDSGISAEEAADIGEYDDDGCNVVDPTTGIRYFQCCSCGMVGDLDDSHSAGECNFCHGVNKDD